MNVSTWGEIDSSWIGRRVRVRWEDAGMPLAEGLPSGMPHEFTGRVTATSAIVYGAIGFSLVVAATRHEATAIDPPAHALVQEEEP